MRFYLTGQRTFGNRGCEAIVRSTVLILNQTFGKIEVLVPSEDIVRDKRQWPESGQQGVRFVDAYLPAYNRLWVHLQRLPFAALKRAGWPFPFPKKLREEVGSCDAVLSVGGDNYSLDYRMPSLLMGMDRLAMELGKPVFIWGASVGPFEAEPYFLPAIHDHLAKIKMIAARESLTYNYLTKTLGLNNVIQMADPAFTLKKESVDTTSFWPQVGSKGVVGLNISPLIERFKKGSQDLRAETIKFIHEVVARGFGVLLVPHVIPLDGAEQNNDFFYMADMMTELKMYGDSVTLMPEYFNASQIKQVISQLHYFIGARTHATIAALSSSVPTLSIAYSVKAKGINKDLLGDMPVVLSTPELTSASLMTGFDYLVENETQIKICLERELPTWREQVGLAASEIKAGMEIYE
ncbi:polysaccharide pyruvyl transferase family protein [uncultured Microbulbifer sp.]|uniref:polysaccharide pyruvyl transferase family protein n=1 Tax=uncultured Microbulbifer sp. TaxID=348147 RepID=UPI002639D2B2|nr:polysaccharide pyruvyl transferase family protein [uncultured Microbulbifer sp.]